jgi:hypothetical protein
MSLHSCVCLIALALVAGAMPGVARSQDSVSLYDAVLAGVEPSAPQTPDPITAETVADLARRLADAEKKLADLEGIREAEKSSAGDKAVDLRSAIQRRWEQVKDPSITTVDQQTHKSGEEKKEKKWYDRLSIRGYAQFRFNEITHVEEGSAPPQHVGDRSVDEDQSFFIRRARLILSGDVSDHLYVYIQPDFASGIGSVDSVNFAQIRDWYGDLYIDKEKVYRVRVGQSKVPFGWENLQSSSNRLALDRSDSLNSAVKNERDLGAFFYYTPERVQDLFKYVLDEGLKGSGNYGMLGIGAYAGQGGSQAEQNEEMHLLARLAVPYQFPNCQVVEFGVQGYTGEYVVLSSPIQPLGVGPAIRPAGTLERGERGLLDQRIAGTFIWYPQPLGFQTEWNVGRGPALNADQLAVDERSLRGGYAMVMYRQETTKWGTLFPFGKYNHFEGGYRSERNAPYVNIDEWEFGVEWQFNPQMELVTQYTITDRTNTTARATGLSYGQFEGNLVRMQFQMNY